MVYTSPLTTPLPVQSLTSITAIKSITGGTMVKVLPLLLVLYMIRYPVRYTSQILHSKVCVVDPKSVGDITGFRLTLGLNTGISENNILEVST